MKIGVVLVLIALALPVFADATATPIKHVIIIIEENHSFDNLFGLYPFGYPPIINNITLAVMRPEGLPSGASAPILPWFPWLGSVEVRAATGPVMANPSEGYLQYHGDVWFGAMSGFVYFSGPASMVAASYQNAGPLWDYAEEYVLADAFYAARLSLTEPNRVAALVGFPPSFDSDSASGILPFNETIMYQLSKAGVSWGYYVYDYRGGVPYPLTAFAGSDQYRDHYGDLGQLYAELKNCSVPAVAWAMFFGGGDSAYSLHPPDNMTAGEAALVELLNAVEGSACWNEVAVFIWFDEGGGFYDHVAPPRLGPYNFGGLGQRVPLLIISPYAKEAWVDNYTMSPYTILAFVDYNWGLPPLTSYVADSDLPGLLAAFNFSAPPRPPMVLTPENWTYPIPLQYPVHYGYVAEVRGGTARGPPAEVLATAYLALASLALAAVSVARPKRATAYALAASTAVFAASAALGYAEGIQFAYQLQEELSLVAFFLAGVGLLRLRRRSEGAKSTGKT